jgi:demethylmenaquinone methyltransferase/2-methoxy-6-polyprenyl-1,4-benzoquinol methylase
MKKGVQKIYSEVAHTYELVNHVLTFGMDSVWRKKAVQWTKMAKQNRWMDICSGTGDMIPLLSRQRDENTLIIASDFSQSMISRAKKRYSLKKVYFCLGDAVRMPFEDETFDLIIISFATRNIDSDENRTKNHFREFHRLIRPGGIFLNLETSQPSNTLVRTLFHLYARYVVKTMGFFLSGSRAGYRYLSHTLTRFHDQKKLTNLLYDSGFSSVESKTLFLGVAAIHRAIK